MCGFVYTNQIRPSSLDLIDLIPRGPNHQQSLENELGYFFHCRLITRPTSTTQPAANQHGILLYNGTEYNLVDNDTDYILGNLTNDLQNNVDFIKTLQGDFSICFVTDEFILLARDCFGTKPLFYGSVGSQVIVASTAHTLRSCNVKEQCVDSNGFVILDRQSGKLVKQSTLVDWDLTQGSTNIESIWAAFENSVLTRYDNQTLVTLSSGYDTGAIAACLNKHQKSYSAAVWPNLENQDILDHRIKLHSGTVSLLSVDKKKKFKTFWTDQLFLDGIVSDVAISMAEQAVKDHAKVVLTGTGADDLYCDYGYNSVKLIRHSKFGGNFPEDLNKVWPWHIEKPLSFHLPIVEYINGLYGLDSRHPFLDRTLFQVWLNSSSDIKNRSYKHWIEQYLLETKYPFHKEKIGISLPRALLVN